MSTGRPSLAVWKFSSCDGCQLTLLDCEDDLLAIAEAVDVAYFPEATRAERPGPYDISIVEGSVTTAHDVERITAIRESSGIVIAVGACATAGGIQALKNTADVGDYITAVYPHPEFIDTLATSTPISAHIDVDLELRGCPISKTQLVEAITSLLAGRRPHLPTFAVCVECKLAGVACVMVGRGEPCLGPVTMAGCGALCPSFDRGCYGCFGPAESPNMEALRTAWQSLDIDDERLALALATFNVYAPEFREVADAHER